MKKIIIVFSSLIGIIGIVTGSFFGYLYANNKVYNYAENGYDLVYCEKSVFSLSDLGELPVKPSFESSDKSVFTIDSKGNGETFTPGVATLTIRGLGFEYEFPVTVRAHEGEIVNCEVAYKCVFCGNDVLVPGGHRLTELTCEEDSYCTVCGYVKEVHPGHAYNEATCETPEICKVCGAEHGVPLGHNWVNGDCNTPQNCSVCLKLADKPLGHEFTPATCTEDSKCIRCEEPGDEKATGHTMVDATCEEPKRCEACDYTEGKPLGHKADKVDCTVETYCTRCNIKLTEAGSHDFSLATCQAPKSCKICKKTEGSKLPHTVVEATCTKGAYCSVCNTSLSGKVDHYYVEVDGGKSICAYCGKEKSAGYVQIYQPSGNADISTFAEEVLKIVNAERSAAGLGALTMNDTLCQAANIRAEETTRSFSHTRPDGRRCFTALSDVGYSYGYAGENIAYDYNTPESVMFAWMHSEGHRANILNSNYNYLGVGVYSYGGSIYCTQFFSS